MSDQAQLERRYRRLLACYPRDFREEHEEEMLVVLLACARTGRRQPGVFDTVNLLWNALRLRIAPPTPRSVPSVFWGVRLILLTAGLELVALVVVLTSQGAVDAAVTRHLTGAAATHATALVRDAVAPVLVGAPILTAAWLVVAWANARGHSWGRGAMVALSMLSGLSLLTSIARHSAAYAPADLIAGIVLCATAVAATALIVTASSDSHYGPRGHNRSGEPPAPVRTLNRRSPTATDIANWN